MKVRNVEIIPERIYPFKLSEQTKKWIEFLEEIPEGETVEISESNELNREQRERRLRVIRDRLKSASKRANGEFEFCRRNNAYYVKRFSDEEITQQLNDQTTRNLERIRGLKEAEKIERGDYDEEREEYL